MNEKIIFCLKKPPKIKSNNLNLFYFKFVFTKSTKINAKITKTEIKTI